jgi:hypothetical protein
MELVIGISTHLVFGWIPHHEHQANFKRLQLHSWGLNCLLQRRYRDREFEFHSGHRCMLYIFFLLLLFVNSCVERSLAMERSPAQGRN